MSEGPRILVIDDERAIRRLLRVNLEADGYQVHEAATGSEGLKQAAAQLPDLIILDWQLPDLEGIGVLKQLREWSSVPVIALSVRDADQDIIAMLDAGADDYLTKPFSPGQLLARMRVALRHTQPAKNEPIFHSGRLAVDLARRFVTVRDQPVHLSTTEYALLRLLVQHAGKVLTRHQILREVWGPSYVDEMQYLRVYMRSLRRKLENNPDHPELLLTEPGVGYKLECLPSE